MKKPIRDVDFMYPSEEAQLRKYENHHSRNQGQRSLIRAIHHAERQVGKSCLMDY